MMPDIVQRSPGPGDRRRAKIVCTLGPASAGLERITQLVQAGMDIARLNFSHGDRSDHERMYRAVRQAASDAGRTVGILADLQGPKIRLGRFAAGPVEWRHWSGHSALSEPGAMRQYGIILGVEFGVAAAGAAAIALLRHSEYVAPWVCLVVGVHFFPMAPVLKSPPLFVLGAVLIAVAAAAVLICRGRDLALSAVTGAGAGMALLGYASLSILVGIA